MTDTDSLQAPHPWADTSLSADARAELAVAAMTDDEKFSWISGPMALPMGDQPMPEGAIGSGGFYPAIPRLGLPAIQQSDASLGVTNPMGIRQGDDATALPSSLLLGATFDPELAHATGAVVGREARAKGFNVVLGGGANLLREARGGRNFEYVSEDPLVTGVIAGASIAGIQSERVVSTTKHFVLNPEEISRVMASSDIGEGALRESDLLAFQIAIEHGEPGSVMTAYNLVNGAYAGEHEFLISDVLKGDWGYPGWVMSDWGATHSTELAALAGLDCQSGANLDPVPYFGQPLRDAVAAGRVPQARIDDMVRRILRSLFAAGVVDDPPQPGGAIDYDAHRLLAQCSAENGIVLLKNEGRILPLASGLGSVLVIGAHADQGVLAGGGSSEVRPVGHIAVPVPAPVSWHPSKAYHPSPPLEAIKAEAGAGTVEFLPGDDIAVAVAAARAADVVIVFGEQWRTESIDVPDLALPDDQDALIAAVAAANPRTIVVLETGGPVAMPWLAEVPAVIEAWYPGSGGGPAIAGVLFGRVNPAGRLPVSFPAHEKQLPRPQQRDPKTTTSDPGWPIVGDIVHVDYDIEGSDVGYRWHEREGHEPLFPFGFGLSYTEFERSALEARWDGSRLVTTFTVTNVGDRAGIDTPQIYVARTGADGFAGRLAAFTRVELAVGESRTIEIAADSRLLARFDTDRREFVVAAGEYEVRLAESATSIVERITVEIPAFAVPARGVPSMP